MVALLSDRMKREAGGHAAVELAFEVARRVLVGSSFAVGLLLVAEHGDRREQLRLARQHGAFGGGLKGGSVDKGLEDGAGGPMRDGVVDLAVAVAAAADQSEDLPGVGIQRDQRDLGIDVGLAGLLVLGVDLVDLRVDGGNGLFDGFGSELLQVGIERSVDAQAFLIEVAFAELLVQLLVDEVDEVGRFAGVDAGRGGEMKGRGLGVFACSLVIAPVSTMESSTRLRRSMARSGQ
jgi:hypothetical protein